jgi:tetratricopeptide (TPR) repeat protein
VPETDERGEAQIRVEIVAGREQRPLFTGIWNIEAPVRKGEALWLTYRYDENQVLHLEMSREGKNNQKSFHAYVENPLTHVVNPNETRVKIDEIEEKLRTGQIPREQIGASLAEVAGLYRQLGQNEKALDYYSRAIQAEGEPSSGILNRMATCANDLGDRQRAEQLYAEAARVDPWSGTYFNWSHAKEAWGETRQAFELVNRALEMDFDPAYLVLKARLEQKLRNQPEADSLLEQAREGFGDPESLDLFGLSWLLTLARMVSDDQLIKQVNEIMARKKAENEHRVVRGGCLPDLDGESEGKTR